MNTNTGGKPDPELGCGILLVSSAIMLGVYIVVGFVFGPLVVVAAILLSLLILAGLVVVS